ncbi:MAG: hypothetical protein LH609_14790 [Rudanella sp.]|nr:hypothetical protein [Rudanella sp.]
MELEQKIMYVLVFGGLILFVVLFLVELLTGQPHSSLLLTVAIISTSIGLMLRFGEYGRAKK